MNSIQVLLGHGRERGGNPDKHYVYEKDAQMFLKDHGCHV